LYVLIVRMVLWSECGGGWWLRNWLVTCINCWWLGIYIWLTIQMFWLNPPPGSTDFLWHWREKFLIDFLAPGILVCLCPLTLWLGTAFCTLFLLDYPLFLCVV
jgi:hypothetical protein